MHCLLLSESESNHLFLNTLCRVTGGTRGGGCSLHAWKCLQLENIYMIFLSCDHAPDQTQLLPAEHLGKGGCSGRRFIRREKEAVVKDEEWLLVVGVELFC